MSVQDLGRTLDRHVRRAASALVQEAEPGIITPAGLQLERFAHPIPDWQVIGEPLPIGARVVAIPLAGGRDYLVLGPISRQGVTT